MLPLIDAATRELLLAKRRDHERNHPPVLKLFNSTGPATWLLCAMEADGDTLFGLCDLGFGESELGYDSLDELKEVSASLMIGLERDLSFRATHPTSLYTRAANATGRIVELGTGPKIVPDA